MKTAATRSLEMAVDGLTLNRRISMGVISAPPPAPVSPTKNPTTALPRTMYGSMFTDAPCYGSARPVIKPNLQCTGREKQCIWVYSGTFSQRRDVRLVGQQDRSNPASPTTANSAASTRSRTEKYDGLTAKALGSRRRVPLNNELEHVARADAHGPRSGQVFSSSSFRIRQVLASLGALSRPACEVAAQSQGFCGRRTEVPRREEGLWASCG